MSKKKGTKQSGMLPGFEKVALYLPKGKKLKKIKSAIESNKKRH